MFYGVVICGSQYRKKKFELFALSLLGRYASIEVKNFESKESPDFQDSVNSIGIEVTKNDEGAKFWKDLEKVKRPVPDSKIKKFNKKFLRNGGRICDKKTAGIIFGNQDDGFDFNKNHYYIIPSYPDDFSEVNKSIECKLKKLNNNYNHEISDNRLFVLSSSMVTRDMVEEELKEMVTIQQEYKRKFSMVYVWLSEDLYIFDLVNLKWEKIKIDNDYFQKSWEKHCG